MSREAFVEYLSSEGALRCDGVTVKGERCSAGVADVSRPLGLEAWKKARAAGGYCRRHGG